MEVGPLRDLVTVLLGVLTGGLSGPIDPMSLRRLQWAPVAVTACRA